MSFINNSYEGKIGIVALIIPLKVLFFESKIQILVAVVFCNSVCNSLSLAENIFLNLLYLLFERIVNKMNFFTVGFSLLFFRKKTFRQKECLAFSGRGRFRNLRLMLFALYATLYFTIYKSETCL